MTTRPPITGLAWVKDFETVKKTGEEEDRQVVKRWDVGATHPFALRWGFFENFQQLVV